ncbi:MAG: GatB/YqeY domain-containing protein, partial [Chloroflexota bacterium]
RSLNAELKQVEIDQRKELTAEDVIGIISKQVKLLRESIAEKQDAGRDDLVAEDETKLAVLNNFLPEQMSREEIATLVASVIEQVGANTPKDMGKVMGALMPQVKGKADGKLVNEVVRAKLSE